MNNEITQEEMHTLCKIGQGAETCRYLGNAGSDPRCLKHTALAARVDDRVKSGSMIAQGDNCEGKKP